MPIAPGASCPCGSGRPFAICCAPLLAGEREAGTALELMRSRYTAHAVGDEAYLHRTHAPTADKPYRAPRSERGPELIWTRLVIHAAGPGPKPDTAYVDFSAFYRDERGEHELRENSEFKRKGGRWLYVAAR